MTNNQIIITAAIISELYTEDEAIDIIVKRGCLPLHTFAEWKKLGYSVRKGEHAKLTTRIWRLKKGQKATEGEDEEESGKFYLTKAHFFTEEQVKAMA